MINIATVNDQPMPAYIAEPETTPAPGLVLIQELFAVNRTMRDIIRIWDIERITGNSSTTMLIVTGCRMVSMVACTARSITKHIMTAWSMVRRTARGPIGPPTDPTTHDLEFRFRSVSRLPANTTQIQPLFEIRRAAVSV